MNAPDPADYVSTLFDVLAAARRSAGLSQRELADRLGCSHSRIGRFERGQVDPFVSFVQRYAREVGVEFRIEVQPDGSSS